MATRHITCPTCAHAFAVPGDARTAICSKCGKALPILAARISLTQDEVPLPRRKEAGGDGAKLARINLRKAPGPPAPPPPPPPAATGLAEEPNSGVTNPGAQNAGPPAAAQAPPLPELPPLPARKLADIAHRQPFAVSDRVLRTGVDLPLRPVSPVLDSGEFKAAQGGPGPDEPTLVPSQEEQPRLLPLLGVPRPPRGDPTAPEPAITLEGEEEVSIPVEAEGEEPPGSLEQIVDDEWMQPVATPLERVPTATDDSLSGPRPLPPLELGQGRPGLMPSATMRGRAAAPPPPEAERVRPVPPSAKSFHRDLSPSQRVAALHDAIEDEAWRAGASEAPPDEEASAPTLDPSPPASGTGLAVADPAPFTLPDTGIPVVIPDAPVEEVPLGQDPAQQPEQQIHYGAGPSKELAPISRHPPRAARGHGVATREPAGVTHGRQFWIALVAGSLLGLIALVSVVLILIRHR